MSRIYFYLVILLYISTIFISSYLYPPINDMWGYLGIKGDKVNIVELIYIYYHNFQTNNPRLGQYILFIAGYSPFYQALTNTLSILLLLGSCLVLVAAISPKVKTFNKTKAIFIITAVIIFSGDLAGQMLFYAPYNANYVFGFGLLLFFFALLTVLDDYSNPVITILLITIGFLAGLTNEHTIPTFLAAAPVAFVLIKTGVLNFAIRLRHFIAYLSLLAGFLALYFAPGQELRYGPVKNDGFMAFFDEPGAQIIRVLKRLLLKDPGSIILFLAGLVLVIWCFSLALRRRELEKIFWPVLMIAAAFCMALTTLVSPIIPQRLMFSSCVALAISITGCLYYLQPPARIINSLLIISIVATGLFLSFGLFQYKKLHSSYTAFAAEIDERAAQGETDIIIKPYDYAFKANEEFVVGEVFLEDPNHRLNKLRARVFDVHSVSFDLSTYERK